MQNKYLIMINHTLQFLRTSLYILGLIKSKLLSEVIKLTCEGEKYEDILFEQIKYLTERMEEHTGVGLYVYFKHDKGIKNYKLTSNQLNDLFGKNNHQIEKFELINSTKNILADLTVHFSEGLIDCVEIWNKLGDYPKYELTKFVLKKI